ncbi:MAG: hypothetical protein RMJ52_15250 [Gemmataceae bacterium]|nr:hypothetical protein [Gemmataceae bacterium]
MLELDIRIDTDLRDRAVEAVKEFVKKHGTPVSRTQIAGLLQIAGNEPGLISRYAGNQKERAEKRLIGMKEGDNKTRLENEVDFWKLVVDLCVGKGSQHDWSLAQECEKQMPDHLKNLVKPHATDKSGRETYNRLMAERNQYEKQWNRDHYPSFFRHFCAEYLYRMPPE